MALGLERSCDVVAGEIERLAALTEGADPATPVPSCPGWDLGDLLRHTGEVSRWAAAMVRSSAAERLPRERMDWGLPADRSGYPAWIAAGAAEVLPALRACDPGAPMWAWGWPKAAGFWPRRMAHEVGVHRADAELALGGAPGFEPEVAADGVAELLDNLPHAAAFAPGVAELRGDGEVLALRATDADLGWRIELGPEGFAWRPGGAAAADAVVAAPAGDLLLALYGRPAAVEIHGDGDLWARWRRGSAI